MLSSNTMITSFHLLHIGVKYYHVTYKRISNGKMGEQLLVGILKPSFLAGEPSVDLAGEWTATCALFLELLSVASDFKNSSISFLTDLEAFIMKYMDEQFLTLKVSRFH